MTAPLSGSTPADIDLERLDAGDRLTIMLDGFARQELHLKVLRVAPVLAHRRNQAWVCGIDLDTQRLRDVLVRTRPPIK